MRAAIYARFSTENQAKESIAELEGAKRRDFDIIVAEDSSRLWREQAEQWRAL